MKPQPEGPVNRIPVVKLYDFMTTIEGHDVYTQTKEDYRAQVLVIYPDSKTPNDWVGWWTVKPTHVTGGTYSPDGYVCPPAVQEFVESVVNMMR